MNKIISILLLIIPMTCSNADKDYPYTFFSTKNYDGTAVEELVGYVKENDTLKIVQFLSDHKDVDIDTPDKYFGYSLLMWAIFNSRYEAFHCLINHGANVSFKGGYLGHTPLYMAVEYVSPDYEHDPRYCKELLEHGANPNEEVDESYPINAAVARDLEYTKLLVEYGADLTVGKYYQSPADLAIIYAEADICVYLICEKGAVLYNEPQFNNWILDIKTLGKNPSDDDLQYLKKSISARNKILNYLKQHSDQMQLQYRDTCIVDDKKKLHDD